MKRALVMGLGMFLALGSGAAEPEKVFEGSVPRPKGSTAPLVPCEMVVSKTYFKGGTRDWSEFRADVSTSFTQHGDDELGDVTIAPVPGKDDTLEWKGTDGSTLRVKLAKESDFDSASNVAVRWKHGTHFHSGHCEKLKLKAQP